MEYTLQQRIERALDLRAQGYNCSQCVAMAFDDVTALSTNHMALATAAFGGGIAGTRGTCGTVTGMSLVNGARLNLPLSEKKAIYADTRILIESFVTSNGSVICAELRKPGKKTCAELIIEAVTLMHNHCSDNA